MVRCHWDEKQLSIQGKRGLSLVTCRGVYAREMKGATHFIGGGRDSNSNWERHEIRCGVFRELLAAKLTCHREGERVVSA